MKFIFLRELSQNASLEYSRVFCGSALDDRGNCSIGMLMNASKKRHVVTYDLENFILNVDDVPIKASESKKFLELFDAEDILIDATTLDVPELLLLTKFFSRSSCKHISYLYVEPKMYKLKDESGSNIHGFLLSSAYGVFSPIPGFMPELSAQKKGKLLAFLGFEPGRLRRVLSAEEVPHIGSSSVVFGVPPFQTSWEMHALMQNAEVLIDETIDDVYFVGANDPLAAYNRISKFSKSVAQTERLVLAALGTKPASIGVVLFASFLDNVRIVFDFPQRLPNRTEGIGKIHHYAVSLE